MIFSKKTMEQLSAGQNQEALKILKYIKEMETIIQTSPNAGQVERLRKDVARCKSRLAVMMPNLNILQKTTEQIAQDISLSSNIDNTVVQSGPDGNAESGDKISELEIRQASPHCNDPEINVIASVLGQIDEVYWSILSDSYCKMDYTHIARRDSLRLKLEAALRSLKDVLVTMEDLSKTLRPDSHEQLFRVKNRHTRSLIMESDLFLKSASAFLQELLEGSGDKKNILQNPQEKIQMPYGPHENSPLKDKTIFTALSDFYKLCKETIAYLSMPDFKAGF